MEIIDISKFYRFESIPNPLVIASDIIHFNDSNNENKNHYIEIDNYKQWFSKFNTKKYFNKFDEILTIYSKLNKDVSTKLEENSSIKEVLNNSSIYLIIKTNRNNSSFTILPISNLETLSNTAVNRLYLHRDGLFEIDPNPTYDTLLQEKSTTDRRFYFLNDLLTTQGVFDSELDTKTKDLTFDTEDDLRKRKGLINQILGDDPKFYSKLNYENLDYLPEIDPEPEYRNTDGDDKDSIWLEKYGIPRQDYEYNEAEMDNTLFNNPTKYSIETAKEIFPLFANATDAENFLLTTFEDLLEPLKKKRITITKKTFFDLTRKEQYSLLLPTSYVLNIENSEVSDPLNLNLLTSSNKLSIGNWFKYKLFYNQGSSQQIKEKSNLVNNYKINNFDQNYLLPISTHFLLDQAINIGILEIGLGDFLDLWFSKEKTFFKSSSRLLRQVKMSKFNNSKGSLLFIPKLIENPDGLDLNSLYKSKQIEGFEKIFRTSQAKSPKLKFIYQLGKVMELNEVNSLIPADLKL